MQEAGMVSPKRRPYTELAVGLAPSLITGGVAGARAGIQGLNKLFGGGKELAEALKTTTASRVSEEAAKAGKRAETAESRAGAAERITEREAGKPAAAYGELPGVIKITEAGVVKPIPQSADLIGTTIRDEATKVYDSLKATRQANAEKNKADAFSFARSREFMGEKPENTKAYGKVIDQIDALLKDKTTGLAVATLDPIKNPLLAIRRALDPRYVDEATGAVIGKPVNFQGLEDLRRFLRDRSYGLPAEGFDAINQQRAGKLADAVENVMSEFSNGKIDKFIKQYRQDSEPLRVFQTKLGKSMVDEQLVGKGVNYASVPAQNIPGKAFKSPDEYYALVDVLGGNEKLAQQQAQRYFAAQMESVKDARAAETFIRNNRTMLKETGAMENAEKYAIALRDAEKRGARATGMGETRAATAKVQRELQNDLALIQTDLDRATKISEINTQVNKVANALEKAKVINVAQRDKMLKDIQAITDLQEKSAKLKQWMKYGAAAVAGSGVGEAIRIYTK
jgi:hypothetical protein